MTGRLGMLTTLYVTQYLGVGFITVGLTAILRDGGTSLETLALLQIVGLVWPVKFLWAPILDRYGSRHRGHYRSWLLVLQTGLVLALAALLPFDRPAERLGPVSFEIEGIHAHDVSEILDRHGVAVRAGHHCAQVLMERLGIAATARASFGVYTTPEEIDRLVEGLDDARRVFGLR